MNSAGAEYVIVGGLVAILYGRVRTTSDIDIIIDFDKTDQVKLGDLLRKERFEVSLPEIEKALAERSYFTIFDVESPYRLDAQGVYKPLDEASLKGRRKGTLFGEQAWIEGPEDLIVAKLVYGSQQDFEDDLAVLLRQKSELDIDYLKRQAAKNRVGSKLKKLLASVEKPSKRT
jgi:hypothetical protein